MRIRISSRGNFKKTENLFTRIKNRDPLVALNRIGRLGVDVLTMATPKDSGLTASSWYYKIEKTEKGYDLNWLNSNIVSQFSVALLLQLGHATGTGGYVPGIDYINPVMEDLFKAAKIDIWKEVSN